MLIHPQSVIHSLVELADSSLIAQLSRPDMRFAITYALTYPERAATDLPELDFAARLSLDLQLPEPGKYPALEFAREAMERGGTLPGVMNAANEVAVDRFRRGEIPFPAIWKIIETSSPSQLMGLARRTNPSDATRTASDFAWGVATPKPMEVLNSSSRLKTSLT